MAYLKEGIKKTFSGTDVLARHITLFSVCGIAALAEIFIGFAKQDLTVITIKQKVICSLIILLFTLFFTGYEVLFMKEREIPDIDMKVFKIFSNKIMFFVFFINAIITAMSIWTNFEYPLFISGFLLIVPLTMLQTGFSYNFDECGAFEFLKKFNLKDYIILSLKALWVFLVCNLVALGIVFVIILIALLIYLLVNHAEMLSAFMNIISHQIIITKLFYYLNGIVLTYVLTLGNLAWDYELIRTFEKNL